jgi:hypothetical protein
MLPPNILEIYIEEPTSDPARPSIHHSLADDLSEAENRYRALIQLLISQLTGLRETHVRFIVCPDDQDALEAVSFWILPMFRGKVIKHGEHFHFTPEQNAPEFTIEFTADTPVDDSYEKAARLSAHCPECGSRWINAAMQQCSETSEVIGKNYLSIIHQKQLPNISVTELPELLVIHTDDDWQQALESPIGPKLNKFHNEISRDLG